MQKHLMNSGRLFLLTWITLVGLRVGLGADELPPLAGLELTDLAGDKHKLGPGGGGKLTVLIFLGTECPISNGYAPSLKRLYASLQTSDVLMLGIHCDPDVTSDLAQTHAREYELSFALALDHDQRLARACGVHIVPTAVVVGAEGRIVYRGRIDNRYVATGVRRPEATVFDLKTAVETALAGRQPDPVVTEAIGCPLPPPRE